MFKYKIRTKKSLLFKGILFAFLIAVLGFFPVRMIVHSNFITAPVLADDDEEDHEDDEDEDENEDEEDDEDGEGYYRDNADQVETEEIIIYESVDPEYVDNEIVPEKRFINVVDFGYDVDTDGDQLVDAVDPDPYIHQKEYYTDSDGDSVANVFDEYPDENDFIYIEFEDSNQNGILDFFEPDL